MQNYLIPLVKILGLSTLIAFIIKYGSPLISLTPSFVNVMVGVFLPTLILAVVLCLRWQNNASSSLDSDL